MKGQLKQTPVLNDPFVLALFHVSDQLLPLKTNKLKTLHESDNEVLEIVKTLKYPYYPPPPPLFSYCTVHRSSSCAADKIKFSPDCVNH